MTLIEAAKQALEALIDLTNEMIDQDFVNQGMDAITALRTAIAEAEKQEPVAWINGEGRIERHESLFGRGETIRPLSADYHAWLDNPLTKTLKQSHKDQLRSLRMRIINMLEIQHEAAKDTHNYWLVAANLIRVEFKEPK